VLEVPFARLVPGAGEPTTAHAGDAGRDLRSVEALVLEPGERRRIRTGIAIALPEGTAGLVLPRSGLAAHHGVTVLNAPGLIDSGFRGELEVCLLNTDRTEPFPIAVGDRIAQLVIVDVAPVRLVAVEELDPTPRGGGGYGSTGRS
jgi:dUTP pyrophosphatase